VLNQLQEGYSSSSVFASITSDFWGTTVFLVQFDVRSDCQTSIKHRLTVGYHYRRAANSDPECGSEYHERCHPRKNSDHHRSGRILSEECTFGRYLHCPRHQNQLQAIAH